MAHQKGAPASAGNSSALAVFCDFDGTFSIQDVGSTLARLHGGELRAGAWARYERGEISAWDYNMLVLDGLPLSEAELEAFLQTVELDPGARDLLHWCDEHEVPFRILSDGFDHNLDRLQQIHSVLFEYDANRLRYEGGKWRIAAGAPDPACGCGTGICKRACILRYREHERDATVVHIGNGRVSDLCGALEADVAFAKDSLAEVLTARRVAFEQFGTLRDVIPKLEELFR